MILHTGSSAVMGYLCQMCAYWSQPEFHDQGGGLCPVFVPVSGGLEEERQSCSPFYVSDYLPSIATHLTLISAFSGAVSVIIIMKE